jgi:hypothetical protein
MPGKVDHRTAGSSDLLDNVFLQDRVVHAKRLALRIEVFLLQIVTIVTVQVTEGATGLGKNLKFTGNFDHGLTPISGSNVVRRLTVNGFLHRIYILIIQTPAKFKLEWLGLY